MTAPDRRRPLPALVAIAALTLLTALVWFRVLHRGAEADQGPTKSTTPCPSPSVVAPTVLPKPAGVTLIVLNSTTRSGLAKNVRKVLITDGFKAPAQATNDGTAYGGHGAIPGVAEIRFGPTERLSAALVAYYLPGATMVQTDSSAPSVIVSLGTQFKAVATAKAAAAAIAAAHVTLTSPAPTPTPTHSASC
jgi:hypothetical protein